MCAGQGRKTRRRGLRLQKPCRLRQRRTLHRQDSRPLCQPHSPRPLPARRKRVPAAHQQRPELLPRRQRLPEQDMERPLRGRRDTFRLYIARRRGRISRTRGHSGDLPLERPQRTRHRIQCVVRCQNHHKPHQPRILQPRRPQLRQCARAHTATERRPLASYRRHPHPHRRDSRCGRHAHGLPHAQDPRP